MIWKWISTVQYAIHNVRNRFRQIQLLENVDSISHWTLNVLLLVDLVAFSKWKHATFLLVAVSYAIVYRPCSDAESR